MRRSSSPDNCDYSGICPNMGKVQPQEVVMGQGESALSQYCYAPLDEITTRDEQEANWILANATSGIHPILARWTLESISRVLGRPFLRTRPLNVPA